MEALYKKLILWWNLEFDVNKQCSATRWTNLYLLSRVNRVERGTFKDFETEVRGVGVSQTFLREVAKSIDSGLASEFNGPGWSMVCVTKWTKTVDGSVSYTTHRSKFLNPMMNL